MWRQDVVRHTLRTRTTVQGSGRGDVYSTRGRPSGETALATAATPTRRTRADPSHQGSAGIGGLDPSPSRSVLRLGAGWSRAEYSGSGRDCGTGASGGCVRARLPALKRLPRSAPISRGAEGRVENRPSAEGGAREEGSGELPRKGCGALISVPVVCEGSTFARAS